MHARGIRFCPIDLFVVFDCEKTIRSLHKHIKEVSKMVSILRETRHFKSEDAHPSNKITYQAASGEWLAEEDGAGFRPGLFQGIVPDYLSEAILSKLI
jgi:hypothetical protein